VADGDVRTYERTVCPVFETKSSSNSGRARPIGGAATERAACARRERSPSSASSIRVTRDACTHVRSRHALAARVAHVSRGRPAGEIDFLGAARPERTRNALDSRALRGCATTVGDSHRHSGTMANGDLVGKDRRSESDRSTAECLPEWQRLTTPGHFLRQSQSHSGTVSYYPLMTQAAHAGSLEQSA